MEHPTAEEIFPDATERFHKDWEKPDKEQMEKLQGFYQ